MIEFNVMSVLFHIFHHIQTNLILCLNTMEGGYFPWKNKTVASYDVSEEIRKPLPPPPFDKAWTTSDDGDWQLIDRIKENDKNSPIVSKEEKIIEHIIMSDDTLQGICLRYNVSATHIRRLNMFSGNSIQCKKSLLIPLSRGSLIVPQSTTKDLLLQKFRNETGESVEEARIYMEDAEYILEDAISAWKIDESWEDEKYLNVIRQNMLSDMKETPHPQRKTEKRTLFSGFLGDVTNMKTHVTPVAIRSHQEVAPLCVVEMQQYVPT